MAVIDLRPDGFTDVMRSYASQTMPARIYAQHIQFSDYAIWLQIGTGQQTMIAYGHHDSALKEADRYLKQLSTQMHRSLAELMAALAEVGA